MSKRAIRYTASPVSIASASVTISASAFGNRAVRNFLPNPKSFYPSPLAAGNFYAVVVSIFGSTPSI